jgi:GTP-binding protein
MVPAITEDIAAEYDILLGELTKYNPELLDKKRLLAISQSDLLLPADLKKKEKKLPKGLPHIFISSVTNFNIDRLKDLLYEAIVSA